MASIATGAVKRSLKGLKYGGYALEGGIDAVSYIGATEFEDIAGTTVGIVGDAVFDAGLATALVGSAAAGPIGWISIIVQLTGVLIDILFNPFQTYYNKDLAKMKKQIDASIRKTFIEDGADYPLEVKPNILPLNEDDLDELRAFRKEYYTNNGIITSEDVISEEDLVAALNLLKRKRRINFNPLNNNINLYSRTNQNIALMIAAVVAKKKGYNLDDALNIDYKNYKRSALLVYKNWVEINWQVVVSSIFSVVLVLIIVSVLLS